MPQGAYSHRQDSGGLQLHREGRGLQPGHLLSCAHGVLVDRLQMQGAELPHVTIYLDKPKQRAAAYVAMSRVHSRTDYLFGGKLSKLHFVPNA